MPEAEDERVRTAISSYSRFVLSLYDLLVLGYNCTVLWRCPARRLLEHYNRFVSANHMDIGVGTGYFLDCCTFPRENPHIALMDLSQNSLDVASRRVSRYRPVVYVRNVIEKFDLGDEKFDSIGMMNLLHCLPGDMSTKGVAFDNANEVLNPGGVVFGSTIFYKGAKRNPLATMYLKLYNRRGMMTNLEDDIEGLRNALEERFLQSSVEMIGCEALFWARKG